MNTNQGQPAAQKPADHESDFLKKNAALINDTARVYGLASKATPEDWGKIREAWKTSLKDGDDWRVVKNHFGMCIVNHGFTSRLFEAIYDTHFARVTGKNAEAMGRLAHRLEFRIDKFTPFVAEKLLDVFYDTKGGGTANETNDLLAAMQQVEKTSDPDVQTLEIWVESSARRRENRAERSAKTQAAIVALADDEGTGEIEPAPEPQPDPRVELQSKLEAALEAAQGRKAQAVAADNDEELTAAVVEIKSLKAELAALDRVDKTALAIDAELATPPTPVPAPIAAAPAASAPIAAPPEPMAHGNSDFLVALKSSKLSGKTKDILVARFASGDETGAAQAFAKLSAL